MAPPGTTNRNRQLRFPLLDKLRNQEIEHRFGMLQKGPRLRKAVEILGDRGVGAREIAQLLDIVRIRQEAHVEHEVGVERQPVFVAEGDEGYVQRRYPLRSPLLPACDRTVTMTKRRLPMEGALFS